MAKTRLPIFKAPNNPGGNSIVTGLLVSHHFNAKFGRDFIAAAKHGGIGVDLLVLPPDPETRIDDTLAARAEVAYFSSDLFPQFAKQFFSATRKAPRRKWMQVFNAGVDHPVSSPRNLQICSPVALSRA